MNVKNMLSHSVRDRYRDTYRSVQLDIKIICGKFARFVWRPPFPVNSDGSINLHLGCGDISHPAFINIDGIPDPHIHYVGRIDKLSQFKDNSVDLIYACHCLEHFSYAHVPDVLTEWHRVLKKNGILRLSVPDFDLVIEYYKATRSAIRPIFGSVLGGQDNKFNYHFMIFNEQFLTELFLAAGFTKVQKWLPGSSDMTTFDDWSGKFFIFDGRSFPVSLNLEALK